MVAHVGAGCIDMHESRRCGHANTGGFWQQPIGAGMPLLVKQANIAETRDLSSAGATMTATITEVIRSTIAQRSNDALSTTLDVIVILLLLVLLVEKELIRAYGSPRSNTWMRALDIVIFPLLFAFGGILIVRFLILL
jgi:hypothetical protein